MISSAMTDAAILVPPPMTLPAPSSLLIPLQVLTFFAHILLVNILLGSVLLAVLDRRSAATEEKNGVAFMPKILALAVNFGIAPFLFLQVLYGNYLYPGILLMAVWWMSIVMAVMLAYYGLYISDGAIRTSRRSAVLIPVALLLMGTAFLLTSASTLMERPDQWWRWFQEPYGLILNTGDATLLRRYLHIILASLAVGGLTMAWRAEWSLRCPGVDREKALHRRRRGLTWFFHVSLAQIAAGLLFLFTLPGEARSMLTGGDLLFTAALLLALAGLAAALFLARRERLGPASLVTAGIILVMVCIRAMLREALLRPYHPSPAASPSTALAMPHGQTAALTMFLICAVLIVPVLLWLARVVLRAFRNSPGTISPLGKEEN